MNRVRIHPGPLEERYRAALGEARSRPPCGRALWRKERRVPRPGPPRKSLIAGWLDCRSPWSRLSGLEASRIRAGGRLPAVLVLGMGDPASLGPVRRLLGTERVCPWRSSTRPIPLRFEILRTASRRRRPSASPPPSRGNRRDPVLLKYFYRLARPRLEADGQGGHFCAITTRAAAWRRSPGPAASAGYS